MEIFPKKNKFRLTILQYVLGNISKTDVFSFKKLKLKYTDWKLTLPYTEDQSNRNTASLIPTYLDFVGAVFNRVRKSTCSGWNLTPTLVRLLMRESRKRRSCNSQKQGLTSRTSVVREWREGHSSYSDHYNGSGYYCCFINYDRLVNDSQNQT